ncbi:MAG: cation diffusion facilitator family transporter [Methanoregulaceae archaeon]|nr:cation diffusion facilitator family transporter [Methanoregulaceae archaeon]
MHEEPSRDERSLRTGIIVTFLFFAVEVLGSWLSGSLSLLSDAGHMFIDAFALILSLGALTIARRLPTKERTFGFHRVEIFAAFINGLALLAVCGGIIYLAVLRFSQPRPIDSTMMLLIALIGLGANLFIAIRLRGSHDVNVRSAFLHVMGDALSSVAVIAAAIWIALTGQTIVDPILSCVIAGVIIITSLSMLRETVGILLQFTPGDVDFDAVVRDMESVPGVSGVHNVHLWSLCSDINILDAHVYSCEGDTAAIEKIKREIKRRLEQYRIRHSTLEFECEECKDCRVVRNLDK